MFQGFKVSRCKMLAASSAREVFEALKLRNFETWLVDDVQSSCYYLKVPRVKSGLPVFGSLSGCATCDGSKFRENLG